MIAPVHATQPGIQPHQSRFLQLLPTILACAQHAFRHLKDEAREDAEEEVIANSFVAFVRLVELGKESLAYGSALARYAVAQFRDGRRVGTRLNVRDVMSPYARRKKHISVERLDRFDQVTGEWREAIVEDDRTPVADQVAFRLDFPVWLASLSARDRRIAEFLALGNAPWQAAETFRVCRSRITQKRHELHDAWQRFHGELPAQPVRVRAA